MNILIVKLSAIGDVIHCLPVAAALKAALPDAHISWLVDKGSAELLRNNECVDEVLTYEGKRWSKEIKNPFAWTRVGSEATALMRNLKARHFDVALEMQGLFKSGALALASGAKIRMGFNGTREFAESFLTHRIDVGDYFGHDVPVVELNLKIVSALLKLLGKTEAAFKPVFNLPPVAPEVSAKLVSLLGKAHIRNEGTESNSRLDCVLIPGTTWVTKIWPADYWYQLGVELVQRYNYRLLIIGANSEIEDNAYLSSRLNNFRSDCSVDLTNKTSLLDLAALFGRTDIVIGGDTGPLHLAAAVGASRVVGIYGSTPWRRNGPYGDLCRSISLQLECQPCYSKQCKVGTLACLNDLTVNHVMDVVAQVRGGE